MKTNDKLNGALKTLTLDVPMRADLLQALAGRLDNVEPLRQELESRRRAFRQGALLGFILGVLATLWLLCRVLPGVFY